VKGCTISADERLIVLCYGRSYLCQVFRVPAALLMTLAESMCLLAITLGRKEPLFVQPERA
jgi:hypothetical protein